MHLFNYRKRRNKGSAVIAIMVIVLRVISAFPLRVILLLSRLVWRAISALIGSPWRAISALPARTSMVITALPAGVHNAISCLVQERFRNMEFFLVGVFLSLLCNVILATSISVFVQTAVIATILPIITSVAFSGFANDWKQVRRTLAMNNGEAMVIDNISNKAYRIVSFIVATYPTLYKLFR